jgi:hypothetical protein
VFWWTDRHFFLLAVIAYGLSAVYSLFLWRKGFRKHDHVNYTVLLAGLVFQTKAMTFVDWTIGAAYLVLRLWPRLRYLGAFATPVIFAIGVFALMPGLDPSHMGEASYISNDLVSLHAALTPLSYGAFGLSSVAGVMCLTQEIIAEKAGAMMPVFTFGGHGPSVSGLGQASA